MNIRYPRLTGGLLLALGGSLCGCNTQTEPPAAPAAQAPGAGKSWSEHVVRGKELRRNENTLRQIALFYQQYTMEKGKPPASTGEFEDYIKRDGREEMKLLQSGDVVLVPNAREASRDVVAYEKNIDLNGNQAVVMGDATIKLMKPEELKAALAHHVP